MNASNKPKKLPKVLIFVVLPISLLVVYVFLWFANPFNLFGPPMFFDYKFSVTNSNDIKTFLDSKKLTKYSPDLGEYFKLVSYPAAKNYNLRFDSTGIGGESLEARITFTTEDSLATIASYYESKSLIENSSDKTDNQLEFPFDLTKGSGYVTPGYITITDQGRYRMIDSYTSFEANK